MLDFLGETSLLGKFDIVRVDLQPSEEYKSVSFYYNIRSFYNIFYARAGQNAHTVQYPVIPWFMFILVPFVP